MTDQKKSDPAKTPAQELPDENLEHVSGGARRTLNPQPLPTISY